MRAIIRKNTNVKQDESMDNKIDQWSNNEGGNKEKKNKRCVELGIKIQKGNWLHSIYN